MLPLAYGFFSFGAFGYVRNVGLEKESRPLRRIEWNLERGGRRILEVLRPDGPMCQNRLQEGTDNARTASRDEITGILKAEIGWAGLSFLLSKIPLTSN